jgi:hypothetical protein
MNNPLSTQRSTYNWGPRNAKNVLNGLKFHQSIMVFVLLSTFVKKKNLGKNFSLKNAFTRLLVPIFKCNVTFYSRT